MSRGGNGEGVFAGGGLREVEFEICNLKLEIQIVQVFAVVDGFDGDGQITVGVPGDLQPGIARRLGDLLRYGIGDGSFRGEAEGEDLAQSDAPLCGQGRVAGLGEDGGVMFGPGAVHHCGPRILAQEMSLNRAMFEAIALRGLKQASQRIGPVSGVELCERTAAGGGGDLIQHVDAAAVFDGQEMEMDFAGEQLGGEIGWMIDLDVGVGEEEKLFDD